MRLVVLLCALALSAPAQCVMCQRTAAAQAAARAQVLNTGIVLLGIPPVVILGAVLTLAYRRRDP